MALRNNVSDKTLHKQVTQRLARTGTASQSRVLVTVSRGTVTISGTLNFENQRRPILRAASGVEGVGTVVDQLHVEVKKKTWQ